MRPVVAVRGVAVSVVLIVVAVVSLYRGRQGAGDAFHAPPRQFLGPPERFHTISQLDPDTVARVRDHPDVANAIEVCGRLFPFRYEEVRDLGFFLAFGPEGVAGGCRPRSAPASRSRPAPS